jgi:hypothetical protein
MSSSARKKEVNEWKTMRMRWGSSVHNFYLYQFDEAMSGAVCWDVPSINEMKNQRYVTRTIEGLVISNQSRNLFSNSLVFSIITEEFLSSHLKELG